jgi:peptide/nickel transport system substrate-binding protein
MFDSRQAGGALDYAAFHTGLLDSLFARTRDAPSADATRDAWVALQQQLARDLPVAWIYHSRGVQGISARLVGVRMDLRGELATVASWRVAGARDSSRTVTAAR